MFLQRALCLDFIPNSVGVQFGPANSYAQSVLLVALDGMADLGWGLNPGCRAAVRGRANVLWGALAHMRGLHRPLGGTVVRDCLGSATRMVIYDSAVEELVSCRGRGEA